MVGGRHPIRLVALGALLALSSAPARADEAAAAALFDRIAAQPARRHDDRRNGQAVDGHATDLAMAGLVNLDFDFGLDLTLGLRYDSVKATPTNDTTKITLRQLILNEPFPPGPPPYSYSTSDTKGGVSWSGVMPAAVIAVVLNLIVPGREKAAL